MEGLENSLEAKMRIAALCACAVLSATFAECAGMRVGRICATGGTAEFVEFVRRAAGCKAAVERFAEAEAMPFKTATNTLFVIAPRYADGKAAGPFDDALVAAMAKSSARGNRFYVENVRSESPAARKFFGVRTFGECLVPFDRRILETDAGLLQFHAEGGYLPAARSSEGKVKERPRIVASVSDALGVNAVFLPAGERSPAVAVSADGRLACALVRLSAATALSMRPRARWRVFLPGLFSRLAGNDARTAESAFDEAWPEALGPAGARPPDEVVEKALGWHEKSGVLNSPDGTRGMKEAVSSGDFGWRSALRTDCNLMTGALFAWAGRLYGRPDWTRLGRNLADNILNRGNQTDEGYFLWFDREARGYGRHYVYATDHGRSTLAVINLYLATGERRYLDSARCAADAFLAWQAEDGLVTVNFDLRKRRTPAKGHSENPVCYYDNIPALFKMSEITGDGKYSAAALKCVETMSAKFPRFDLGTGAFYSANSIYGRYLLIAAAAQRATDVDFSKTINGVLDFYEKNQHALGGISEIKIRLVAHDEAGVGIGDGSDHIADLLYCNNFSFAALSILAKLPAEKVKGIDVAKARRIYAKLRGFLASVQISSPDAKFDGAWMRAYDMDIGEWHGLDKDEGWGPYCIETGWTMGTIPAVFLFDGRDGSYF